MKVFFIFSQYRSGSELLCSLLNSHPDITCIHESLKKASGHQFSENLFYHAAGDDWRDRASLIAKKNPHSRFIGLHGQADMITSDMLNAATEKIMLYRDDEVLGGVKQTLMDVKRVHLGFNLSTRIAKLNIDMRHERNKALRQGSTFYLSYEEMTKGRNIERLNAGLNRQILSHIGAENFRMVAGTTKSAPMLPNNMDEIYGVCNA